MYDIHAMYMHIESDDKPGIFHTLFSEPNFAAIRFLHRVLSVFPAPRTTILSTDALIRAIAVLLIGCVKSRK